MVQANRRDFTVVPMGAHAQFQRAGSGSILQEASLIYAMPLQRSTDHELVFHVSG
jgi:hypothetical protein